MHISGSTFTGVDFTLWGLLIEYDFSGVEFTLFSLLIKFLLVN